MRPWLDCPLCGSKANHDLWTHRPGRSIAGRVVECDQCHTLFKIPDDLSDGVAKYYVDPKYTSDYAALHDGENHRAAAIELREVLQHTLEVLGEQRGSLIDLGCGIGQFMDMAQSAGFRVSGIEINDRAAESAKARTGASVWKCDLDVEPLPGDDYDVITMLDLIEHVQDPIALLRRANDKLTDKGKVVVFTPNHNSLIVRIGRILDKVSGGRVRDPLDRIFDCVHVTFFAVDTLRLALESAGFHIESSKLISYRPERRGEARGVSAAGLRGIEAVSKYVEDGPFRVLMIATKK